MFVVWALFVADSGGLVCLLQVLKLADEQLDFWSERRSIFCKWGWGCYRMFDIFSLIFVVKL